MQKTIKTLSIFFVILLLLEGCASENVNTKQTESMVPNTQQGTAQSKEKQDMAYISSVNGGCKLAKIGESAVVRGFSYTVNSVSYTKQQGNWDDISGGLPKLDVNKKIVDPNKYYIVVNVTVKKMKDLNQYNAYAWNSINLDYIAKRERQIGAIEIDSATIVCQSKEREDLNAAYDEDFKVGEEKTTDLIYVIDLAETGNNPYLMLGVNPAGVDYSQQKPDDYCEIYLEPLKGVFDEANSKK